VKFRTKIWMLPLSASLVFVIGLFISYLVGAGTSAAIERLRTVDNPYLLEVNQIDRRIESFRTLLQAAAAEGDLEALDVVENVSQQVGGHIANVENIAGKTAIGGELRTAFQHYRDAALGATRAMLGHGDIGELIDEMQVWQGTLNDLVSAQLQLATQATLDRQAEADRGIGVALVVNVLTGLAVLVVLGIASYLTINSVWRELGDEPDRLRRAMKRVADGDLSADCSTADDDSSIDGSVRQMVKTLRITIGQIRDATDSIRLASAEIASGNQDLSVRTETTAVNLQHSASALEELTVTVGQSADAARQANQLASAATEAAARGGGIVEQVVANMAEISNASRKIAEIIGVIDGIAFQTNILALNASVEAARAGDQGRGFAVVAGEVQSLAQRSAEAASEIKVLIGASSDKVDSGARLVRDAGSAMNDIVAGVQRVTDIIGEISAAAGEQSIGINSVNQSVAELDSMTQQNAALVEESAAAAASLNEQAGHLVRAVAAFRLQERNGKGSPSPTAPLDGDPVGRPGAGAAMNPA